MWFFPFHSVYLYYLSLFTPSTVSNLHLLVYMYILPMSLYFLSFSFSLSLFLSLSPVALQPWAPQGWAQCTDKQSTHGDPGHLSQNKQQEDVYLCPFHWPWPLLPVRGPALSIATTLPLFLSSGTVVLLETCSKLSHHTEIHVPYLRMRHVAFVISIFHSQIWHNHENCTTLVFQIVRISFSLFNSKFSTVLSRRLFHGYMFSKASYGLER